ncbi:unnamed protein product [Amoebophrya sp. A120]|nr:unnamed protein product [Amoebophrya sp. A120]|eukprot:GSA120T00016224001.1
MMRSLSFNIFTVFAVATTMVVAARVEPDNNRDQRGRAIFLGRDDPVVQEVLNNRFQGFLRTERDYGRLARVSKGTRAALQEAEKSLGHRRQQVFRAFRSLQELEEAMQLWWTDEARTIRAPDGNQSEQNYEDLRNAAEARYGPVEQWDVGGLDKLPEFCHYDEYKSLRWSQMYVPSFRISRWNTRGIRDMSAAFADCGQGFNQPLYWDTSTVQRMDWMFFGCRDFNDRSIRSWRVSEVENMEYMFATARSFNQDLGEWEVTTKLKNVVSMFDRAHAFDQNLEAWDAVLANRRRQEVGAEPVATDSMFLYTLVFHRLALAECGCYAKARHGEERPWPDNEEHDCWKRAFKFSTDSVKERWRTKR